MGYGISDYGSGALLSALFGITSPISTMYLAVCTDEPGPAMDGDVLADVEPADPSYARVPYALGASNWGASDNYVTNSNSVVFAAPSVDWGFVTHWALCTAASSGDLFAWGEFLNPQYATASYQLVIPPGGLVIALDALDSPISI